MKLWVDAQLSPAIAWWLRQTLGLDAHSLKELRLRDAEDEEIFLAARSSHAIVMTQDQDFAYLARRNGSPPQIIWIRSGNTSNVRLKEILSKQWPTVVTILEAGEPLVEVVDLVSYRKAGENRGQHSWPAFRPAKKHPSTGYSVSSGARLGAKQRSRQFGECLRLTQHQS